MPQSARSLQLQADIGAALRVGTTEDVVRLVHELYNEDPLAAEVVMLALSILAGMSHGPCNACGAV